MASKSRRWSQNDDRRPVRRVWVGWSVLALLFASIALAISSTVQPDQAARDFPIPFVFLILGVVVAASPFAREAWFRRHPRSRFDEFERDVIQQADAKSYRILGGCVLIFLAWLWLATERGWSLPMTPAVWGYWLQAAACLILALPVAVAELSTRLSDADVET